MLIKLGVSINRLNRNARRALNVVESVYVNLVNEEAVITSTYEGNHSPSSLHYNDDAFDVRYPTDKGRISIIIDELKKRLSRNYDVIKSNNCIHVEYDPK